MTDQALDPRRSPSGNTEEGTPAPGAVPGPAPSRPEDGPRVPRRPERAPAVTTPVLVRPLPEVPAHFVGRERELAELRADIARPGLAPRGAPAQRARVLLVAGRPGTGRTSLAVRLAREVADQYPDGRFFAVLTDGAGGPVPPEDTARGLLHALGARAEAASPDPVATWRAVATGRRLLLVLDGVQHAGQLAGLLPESAASLVVATSHGPLSGIPDVRPCTLGGLDTPAALALLARGVGDIRVTNDPRAAEALVQELAGHPTALRMVGAWLATRPRTSLSETAALLRATPDTPFTPSAPFTAPVPAPGSPEPAGKTADTKAPEPSDASRPPGAPGPAGPSGASDSPGEQTSEPTAEQRPRPPAAPGELLRAFRVVHASLAPMAARMLRTLVLAPDGSIDDHTASALAGCAVEEAARTLADLAFRGMLAPAGEPGLYRVPPCLEPLLRGLLATMERPQDVRLARARMLERTVRRLESCRLALSREPGGDLPAVLRFASPAAAAQWLRARRPVLLAAARAAVADGELDTLARRLAAALVLALLAARAAEPAGWPTVGADRYELHTLVLTVAERRRLPREKAAALINLADLDAEAGRTERAATGYRAALDAARAAGDTEAEGRVLEALGSSYLALRDLSRACDWFGRALALRMARGELLDQARLHARIGATLTYLGRYDPALREWRAAARAHRRLGDPAAQARALTEAARVQEYAGRPEDALRSCRDALYWVRQVGEPRQEAAVLLRLADVLQHLDDAEGARLQREAARALLGPGEAPAF